MPGSGHDPRAPARPRDGDAADVRPKARTGVLRQRPRGQPLGEAPRAAAPGRTGKWTVTCARAGTLLGSANEQTAAARVRVAESHARQEHEEPDTEAGRERIVQTPSREGRSGRNRRVCVCVCR